MKPLIASTCRSAMLFALLARGAAAQAPRVPLAVGRGDFNLLRWIEGTWRRADDGAPVVWQRFRFVDDSTLVRETFDDARMSQAVSTTRFVLRHYRLSADEGAAHWAAIALDTFSVEFAPASGTISTFSWQRESPRTFIAVEAWPPGPDRPARSTVWHMERVKP